MLNSISITTIVYVKVWKTLRNHYLYAHNLSITFWSDQYHVIDETTEAATMQLKCGGYTYTYIQTRPDYTARLVASR